MDKLSRSFEAKTAKCWEILQIGLHSSFTSHRHSVVFVFPLISDPRIREYLKIYTTTFPSLVNKLHVSSREVITRCRWERYVRVCEWVKRKCAKKENSVEIFEIFPSGNSLSRLFAFPSRGSNFHFLGFSRILSWWGCFFLPAQSNSKSPTAKLDNAKNTVALCKIHSKRLTEKIKISTKNLLLHAQSNSRRGESSAVLNFLRFRPKQARERKKWIMNCWLKNFTTLQAAWKIGVDFIKALLLARWQFAVAEENRNEF